jgi:broad specificity phosphatase PhoE
VIAFVRHGQTASNAGGQLQGRFDAPLTADGEAQAARVADAMCAEQPVRVVTSPLARARTTAAAIAAQVGVEVEVDERLVELDYGDWDQKRLTDVPAEVWREWRANPAFTPPGGESLEAVTTRVVDFCESRRAQWRDELLVAVSHVSPIKAAVCWALGSDERAQFRMQLGLASITRVACGRDGAPQLFSFNETSHLSV